MKIGLLGSGGREHAMAIALAKSRHDTLFVFASHRNPGIERLAERVNIGGLTDLPRVVDYFRSLAVDYVVIGPEAPVSLGVVDQLHQAGISVVGPTQSQSLIEGDKSFMRDLSQRRVGWGFPAWRLVRTRQEAADFITHAGLVAVKPTGLTGGKGVQVMGVHLQTTTEALDLVEDWIQKVGQVLLEERLVGEEFSRMVFVSDDVIVPIPVAQDFKYAYDGDTGGMTGGMGSYTTAGGSMPFLGPEDLIQADRLIKETLDALAAETGQAYRGFLYGQFMTTADGIRVIEYNARLGDPEAINAMLLLQGDVAALLNQVASGELDPGGVAFAPQASLCKYLVPAGYPDDPGDPQTFTLDEERVNEANFSIIYASVVSTGNIFQTLGSRTLAIAGLGDEPGEISSRMEDLIARVEPQGLRHRKDVGDADVIRRKVNRMAHLREQRQD